MLIILGCKNNQQWARRININYNFASPVVSWVLRRNLSNLSTFLRSVDFTTKFPDFTWNFAFFIKTSFHSKFQEIAKNHIFRRTVIILCISTDCLQQKMSDAIACNRHLDWGAWQDKHLSHHLNFISKCTRAKGFIINNHYSGLSSQKHEHQYNTLWIITVVFR